MPHGVPLVVVFLSLAGILALSKIARIFAIRVRVMTVGVTLERRTVCACGGSGGGQAQKGREGGSRDDLRHRRLLWVSGPFRACSVNVTAVSIARMSPRYRFGIVCIALTYRCCLASNGHQHERLVAQPSCGVDGPASLWRYVLVGRSNLCGCNEFGPGKVHPTWIAWTESDAFTMLAASAVPSK